MTAQRHPLQIAIMAEYGAGKSYFAATFPKPMFVIHTDPLGKAAPYFDRGIASDAGLGEYGQPVWQVHSRKKPDKLIIQCEFFHDDEPTQPEAFTQLFNRWASLRDEVREGVWRTVVLDTFTTLELFARYRRTYGALKSDAPNIYSTEDVEQMLSRLCGLSSVANIVINCHIDEKPASMDADRVMTDRKGNKFMTGGQLMATPKAPGRLQKGIGAMFASEMYHLYVTPPDKDGVTQRLLQTQPDGRYACATRIDAPDRIENPTYAALWVNWTAKQASNGNTP